MVLSRKPERLLPNAPDIKAEIVIDFGRTDIIAERYDASVPERPCLTDRSNMNTALLFVAQEDGIVVIADADGWIGAGCFI